MKGYKAMNSDMTCRGYQCTLGHEHSQGLIPVSCEKGFHFCQQLSGVFEYYTVGWAGVRVFEVEATGMLDIGADKVATNSLIVHRELSEQEIVDILLEEDSYGPCSSVYLIRHYEGKLLEDENLLQEMVNSSNFNVRKSVAAVGLKLDVLIEDRAWSVRRAVAEQGYGLDVLVDDEDSIVRCTVAKQGYGLEKLVNDSNRDVRVCAEIELFMRRSGTKREDS